jgi:MFS family permease
MSSLKKEAMTEAGPPAECTAPQVPADPLDWPLGRKIFQTITVALLAFISTLASSIITPGLSDIRAEFNVSAEVALLPFVLYTLGMSIGPLIAGPLSESYGRRNIYIIATPIFALFLLGAGFSQSIASLTVCRFLAGAISAPGLTSGGATLSDIWRKEQRAVPWTGYVTTPFLGPSVGMYRVFAFSTARSE